MPTKRKHPAIKLVTGNPGKRPIRDCTSRVQPSLPSPPDFLSKEALAEWRRVAPQLHDAGVITTLDRAALAAYCQAYGRWKQAESALAAMASSDSHQALTVQTSNGTTIPNPLVGIANKAKADAMRHAAELGMTPAARSRVEPLPPDNDDDDPANEFFT